MAPDIPARIEGVIFFMIYRNEVIITEEFLQYTVDAKQFIIMKLINGLIKDIPIESLYKLFNVQTIDPNSEESKRQIKSNDTPDSVRKMLHDLEYKRQQCITVSINIPS